ncbi:MAG: Asp23/Gls24 family envelope stress response protein [Anaerovoracaceae bacterium]|nr:Asp23/Gls24 family envelope stress response protein [Clostridiales bacterium]
MNYSKDDRNAPQKISDDAIAICAANATLRTEGVADLSSGFSDTIQKNILGREPLYKGIKVSQGTDGTTLDIFVFVKYGSKIPEVSWDIQENVKLCVTDITEVPVKSVNIHIQGVVKEEKD